MRVGFDVDGPGHVFANGVMSYMDTIEHPYDVSYRPDEVDSWDFHDRWGCDRAEFEKIVHAGVDAGFVFRGHVQPGYFEALKLSKDLGHTNIVITDRFFGSTVDGVNASHKATREWFEENGPGLVDEFIFSPDKTIVPTDLFIEDKLANYDALVAAGTKAVLINKPWNQVPGGDARLRIDHMDQFAELIVDATRQGYYDLTLA